jgi:hypothetical protein
MKMPYNYLIKALFVCYLIILIESNAKQFLYIHLLAITSFSNIHSTNNKKVLFLSGVNPILKILVYIMLWLKLQGAFQH